MQETTDELLSLKAAAAKLSIAYGTMHKLVSDNTIPSVYQGSRLYVTPQALRDYIAGLQRKTTTED